MAFGTKIAFEAVRELDFGDVSGTYIALGTPLANHVRLLSLQNGTNEEIYVSFDGVVDHIRMAENSFKLLDLSSNRVRDDGLFLAVGTQIYIKENLVTPTSGSFWAEVIYAEGGV